MNSLTRMFAVLGVTLFVSAFADAAGAAPLFSQCPPVGADTGCQYLITVTNKGTSITVDPSQLPYANNLKATGETGTPTDRLVGVQNNSSYAVTSLDLTGPIIFEFDGDGICNNASGAVPADCQTPTGSKSCGRAKGFCSFPPPPGEPANWHEFGAVAGTPPFLPQNDIQNGYEGPTSWFSNPGPSPNNSGTVNFSPAVRPGGSTYFGLEGTPTAAVAHVSSVTPVPPPTLPPTTRPTRLTVGQTAAGLTGPTLYLPSGVRARATATLSGGSGHPTGAVSFRLFYNNKCSGRALSGGTVRAGTGSIRSNLVRIGASGTYYWQIIYGGDSLNAHAATTCGSQLIVVPPVAKVGLPRIKRCVSSVNARLHIGRRAARAAEVFVNGKGVSILHGKKLHLRVHRRERIAVVVSSLRNAFVRGLTSAQSFRQQSRTYIGC